MGIKTMNTRVGKIARLPQAIREVLNRRLADGERAKDLLLWLNGLPEVQKIMTAQFGGIAVSVANLSEWKRCGHVDWLRHQDFRAEVRCITEQGRDLTIDEGPHDFSENMVFLITAELVMRIRALAEISDPGERWLTFRQIARELSRVRQDDHRFRQNELRRNKWEATLEPIEPDPNAENENSSETPPMEAGPQSGL
jgi:hypothetical protein